MSNLDRIVEALSALLTRENDDAFVIFEESGTGKFVQFVGAIDMPLLLDLPSQALSEEEMGRAKALFREWGVPGPEQYELYEDETCRKPAGMQASFQMEFEKDVNRAAQAALAIFEKVYLIPVEFDLGIEEN